MRRRFLLPALLFGRVLCAQHDTLMEHAGAGVNGGQPESSLLVNRLGNDHAEGITTLDINGDGYLDLVSGAYWYENPGTNGGDWKQHQWRTVSTTENLSPTAVNGR